jgi:hypothetical protein
MKGEVHNVDLVLDTMDGQGTANALVTLKWWDAADHHGTT